MSLPPLPKLFRSGFTEGGQAFPRERAETVQLRISRATTLASLNDEYHFYSPALIYAFVRLMGREPFMDFLEVYGRQVTPITLKFTKPIFRGINVDTDPTWNYVLYGMERAPWAAYREWMGTLAFQDWDLRLITRVRWQPIMIADPLFLERSSVIPVRAPVVPITMFDLETNKGNLFFQTGRNPIIHLPQLVKGKAFHHTQIFARALFAGEDPYVAVAKCYPGDIRMIELGDRYSTAKKEGRVQISDPSTYHDVTEQEMSLDQKQLFQQYYQQDWRNSKKES